MISDKELFAAVASIVDENNCFDLYALAELLRGVNGRGDAWEVRRLYVDAVRRGTNARTFAGRGFIGHCIDNNLPAPLHFKRMTPAAILKTLQTITESNIAFKRNS